MSPSRRWRRSMRASSKPSVVAGHGVEPLVGGVPVAGVDEQAEPRQAATPDPAAQLVQLRDAEPVGVHDDHDAGVGDVDADLDDRRRDEDVDVARRRSRA